MNGTRKDPTTFAEQPSAKVTRAGDLEGSRRPNPTLVLHGSSHFHLMKRITFVICVRGGAVTQLNTRMCVERSVPRHLKASRSATADARGLEATA